MAATIAQPTQHRPAAVAARAVPSARNRPASTEAAKTGALWKAYLSSRVDKRRSTRWLGEYRRAYVEGVAVRSASGCRRAWTLTTS